jgi:hypothetical protein
LRPITAPMPGRDFHRPSGRFLFPLWVRLVRGLSSCALPHIGRETTDAPSQRSEGKPITRGDTAMTKFFRSADDAEIYVLEHRFPFATTLISIFLAGIVVSAIMMLIAQN